jgi:diguanylate cyclase (GGDEF)-like protein/PAS domain S-box-containing protein
MTKLPGILKRITWSQAGGPLVTAAAVVLLEFLAQFARPVPNAPAVVVLVVVFAAFAGGLRPGAAAGAIAWAYFAWHYFGGRRGATPSALDLQEMMVLAAVIPAIVVMVSVLHRRSTEQVSLKLRESEERFKAFMDNSPAVAWMKDDQGRYIYVNAPFELTFNLRQSQISGKSEISVWSPETTRRIQENDREVLARGHPLQLEETLPGKDGRRQHWWILQFPVEDGRGQRFVGGLAVEATERRQAEEALRASEERYALAARSVNDGLWDWNLKTNEVYFSERWKSMLGYDGSEVGASPDEWMKRIHPDDAAKVKDALDDHLAGRTPIFESEHRMRHKDRGYRWVLSRGVAVRNGDNSAYRMVGAQTDTTQRKLAEEQLIHDALYDPLTGLPNRTLFLDRLGHRIDYARRRKDPLFAVLFLDLDRFKVVNDSLGHLHGDELLVQMARRLEQSVRPSDTIARLGGDEFAILLEEVSDVSGAVHVAERIQAALKVPVRLGGQELVPSASIGIALSQSGYEKAEDVLRDADTAMYRAKSSGRARHEVFDHAMHARAVELLQLESELRRAIDHQEFQVMYMPIVSLGEGRISGFEALVRWKHPERGIVPPFEFIGVAEDAGLIIAIDRLVLRQACRQLKEWQERFEMPALTVSVNLSGKQFRHDDLVDQIQWAVKDSGLNGPSLAVEITENVLIESTDAARSMLGRLRQMGIQIYLDDFGTGYSSLSYLQRFPIDTVKIDRSFTGRIGGKKEGQEIIRAIVALAQNLGLKVVAEGVETTGQLAILRALKSGYGQGYLFGKPMPAEEAAVFLAEEPRW